MSEPDELDQMYDAAEKLRSEGKLDEAAAGFRQLVEREPGYALAHSALAVVYTELGRHDDAVRHAQIVCQLEPNDSFSFTSLSVTCMRAGKIPEAEDAMARARMLQQQR